MNRFSPVDVLHQVRLASDEVLVCELPFLRIDFSETICVELADEAGEVLVFEESWKKVF